ncbi:MAG: succinate dehydrogenase/fumarate reductase iron-sulfur subunit [Aquificaceae bacterium]
MKLKIRRYPEGKEEFEIFTDKALTLLDLLQKAKEEDPTLAFRSMCRAGICGTCGVKLGGKPVLACSTWIDPWEEIVIVEPLDGYEIIRDLVVEHEGMVLRLKRYKVWLHSLENNVKVSEEINRKTSKSWECILCGICDSLCPVLSVDNSFGGPLLLTRIHKYLFDPRNAKQDMSLESLREMKSNLCTHCMNCSYVCPKRLMPEFLIKQEDSLLLEKGLVQKESGFDFLSF